MATKAKLSRSRDWSESVSKELKDLDYARTFLSELLNEGDDMETALDRMNRIRGKRAKSKAKS
jgi:hypothetical protein